MTGIHRRSVLSAAGVVLAGCLTGDEREPAAPPDELDTPFEVHGSPLEQSFETTTAVEGIEIPWDIAFASDEVYLTERPGRVRRIDATTLQEGDGVDEESLELVPVDLPHQAAPGEGGVLGIAVHPGYPDPGFVFVYYTADVPGVEGLVNRVVRFERDSPGDTRVILDDIPGHPIHNGGRLAFGPEGRLWVVTGDAAEPNLAQNPASLAGKVLRIEADGEPAGAGIDDGDPRVVTTGHRNLQGIDWLPDTTPIACEHGPRARDEVNLLTEGGNYGWPTARGGPDDGEYASYADHPEIRPPIASSGTQTTWAPSGAHWYDSAAIETLHNRFLFAGLRSERLHVLTLLDPDSSTYDDADDVYDAAWMDDRFLAVRHHLLTGEFGRLRHVTAGPNGSIYLLTSNRDGRAGSGFPREGDDVVVRLDPA